MSANFRRFAQLAILMLAALTSSSAPGAHTPISDWLRGSGKELQIRLHGEILDLNGQPATDVKLTCGIHSTYPVPKLEPTVHGNRFEVWLPVNYVNQYSMWLQAASPHNNQIACKRLNAYELRQDAIDGLQLTLQSPTRHKSFLVQFHGRPISGADVQIELGHGIESRSKTDSDGIARFDLLSDQEINQVTAWTNDYRIGGFSFGRQPTHDPNDDEFVVELNTCRDQRMQFVDQQGTPVPGIEFNLQVATPSPNFNFVGANENSQLRTDESGKVVYRWFPDWKEHYFYADLLSPGWVLVGEPELVGNAFVFKLMRSKERKQINGRVVSTSTGVGGFYVTLDSFQGEREGDGDNLSTFTDADGNFSVDVLPDARYCAWVLDARWVGEVIDLIPYAPSLEQINSPELSVSAGQEVEVLATSGPQHKPIANLTIRFRREYPFQWQENGETERGSGGPQWWATTDDSGRATTRTLPGKLDVSVYTPKWRTEENLDVRADETAKIELHRETDEKRTLHGQLVFADGLDSNPKDVVIQAAAVDGNYDDQQTPTSRKDGSFSFESLATEVAVFASTDDGRMAGSTVVKDLEVPFKVVLRPTLSYDGQLLDADHHPLVGHRVLAIVRVENGKDLSAPIDKWLEAKRIEARTDQRGNYTLRGVPSATTLAIYADPSDGSNDLDYLDDIFLQPNESRPRSVHELGKRSGRAVEIPLAARYRNTLRDCAVGGFRPMLILASGSGPIAEFVHDHFVDSEKSSEVSGFVQITLAKDLDALKAEDQQFLNERTWQLPDPGRILAVALEPDGTELGRLEVDVRDPQAGQAVAEFVHRYAPPQHDAQQEWTTAFAEAQRSNRRVWARVSQRYCGPCFSLGRWLDEQHALLEKDYVMLKIDDIRDFSGAEIARRITRGKQHGVPFHAIFDPDGLLLIDSAGPLGNIGYPAGKIEGKRHLKKMLLETRRNLTDAEIDQLVASVGN